MRPKVAEWLERQALDSLRALTKRGSEIGGLLLGRISPDPHAILIEELEAVACDYSRGPFYLLSEADEARLQAAIAQPRPSLAVVGFFRSNARKELALSPDDLTLAEKYFPGPDSVVLLVKPFSMKPSLGAWFLGQDNFASAAIEFTFRRAARIQDRPLPLPSKPPTPFTPPPASPVATPSATPFTPPPASPSTTPSAPPPASPVATPSAPPPAAPPAPPPTPTAVDPVVADLRLLNRVQRPPAPAPHQKGWLWLPLLLGLIGGSSFFGYRVHGPGLPPPDPAAGALALKVDHYAGQLRLSWNHSASLIATAQKATLTILDGAQEQLLVLDLDQIRTGTLVYAPTTTDVTFRLELSDLLHGKSVTESIRAIVGRPSAFGPPALSLPQPPPAAAAAPPPEAEDSIPAASVPTEPAPAASASAEPAPTEPAAAVSPSATK
jgi:hypothetical protein